MHDRFLQKYTHAPTETKLSFLTHLLHADKVLQQHFLDFIEQKSEEQALPSVKDFAQAIIKYQEEIAGRLQQTDLGNPDWDHYTPSHTGYMKEWERYEDASQQELQDIIDQYQSAAIDNLIGQKLDTMYAVLCGLFIACRDTQLEDPIPCFDSVNEYLTDVLKYTFHEFTEKIDYAILPEELIHQVTLLILDYCLQHQSNDSGFLEAMQPVVHALVKKLEDTEGMLTHLKNGNKVAQHFPLVYSSILQGSRDQKKWMAFAKKTCFLDPEIAKELLQCYYDEKMQKPFILLARKLFSVDQRLWASFLKPLVNLQVDRSLYLDVHLHLIKSDSDIDTYTKIRSELSPKQVNHLIDEILDEKFLVEILTLEKRYEDIKKLVKNNYHSYDFIDIITPILNIFPDYCFKTLKRLVYDQLDNARGRSVYRRIVQKLKLARQIKGYEKSAEKLIQEVYQYNNRLSALKNEMRIGGLI